MTVFLTTLVGSAAYVMAAIWFITNASPSKFSFATWPHTGRLLVVIGIVCHTLILRWTTFPLDESRLNVISAASLINWQIVLLYLLASFRRPVDNLGIIILPIAAIALIVNVAVPANMSRPSHNNWQLDAHIVLSILAYSLLLLAVAQSMLLAIQNRLLHRHKTGGFVRALPPLETMEELLFQMLVLGFFLLSLALVSGLLFIDDLFSQHLVHKTTLSFIAWMIFGVLLWGHWRYGWRGRTAVRWTVSGGAALTLAYFGSKFVLELILGRQWG
ncbi:MAG: cytochrome c biogenesis protein CcsA [Pseudomonadota bacterium]|nr:cytochrome c biogenesis protein CcsA [Pseudomonadota bacterium]